jgi:hypothetical protein
LGDPANHPITFTQGQTVTVQLKFLNAANEDLDSVEGEHFAPVATTVQPAP